MTNPLADRNQFPNRMAYRLFCGLVVVQATITSPVFAQDGKIDECDRAAASPSDQERPPAITGIDIERIDVSKAISACTEASHSEPGNPRVALELGRALEAKGDREAARKLYERSASNGYAGALYELGRFLQTNKSIDERILGDGFTLQAANKGNQVAQLEVADRYYLGMIARPIDEKKLALAGRYYKLAADQGSSGRAAWYTGAFLEYGAGGFVQDDRQAVSYYQLAAKLGHSRAFEHLSKFYKQGRGGLPRDSREAKRLAQLASPPPSPTSPPPRSSPPTSSPSALSVRAFIEDGTRGAANAAANVAVLLPVIMSASNKNKSITQSTESQYSAIVELTPAATRSIQEMLTWTGDYKGPIDGALNGNVNKAITTFKSRNNLPPDELRADELNILSQQAKAAEQAKVRADQQTVEQVRAGAEKETAERGAKKP